MELNDKQIKDLVARRHPEYEKKKEHWDFLASTYAGGRGWFTDNIFRYFKEGDQEFKERVERAYRFNHTREVVNLINKYLFKEDIHRNIEEAPEQIRNFWKRATRQNASIDSFMAAIDLQSSIYGRISACLQAVPFSQSVNITPASPSVLVGKTVQLSAGISMGKSASSFTWKSANDQIATVNGTGLVTGVAPGKVKITATDQETQLSASVEVTVNPVAVQSVTVTPDSTSVEKGKSVSLKANVQPSNATNKAVTWSSKNEDKATVDQSGNVTGVEVGTATIEIVSQDGSKKATATVEVTAPVVAVTGVEIDPNSTTVEANKTVQLTANVEPAGATNKTVTWESKNTEFATVDSETGVVTGVAAGTATIEVTTQDGSHKATATVEVTAAQE